MWWECSECGATIQKQRRPICCGECGTAGPVYFPADREGLRAGTAPETWRDYWLTLGAQNPGAIARRVLAA